MITKYFFRAKISDSKFRTVLRLFYLDIEAKKVAEFTGLNRGCINNIYNKLIERIATLCETESPFEREIELDESYFGARRVRGIRGRGAKGKISVFGMLKRGDRVYTQIVKNCSVSELIPIIKGKADTETVFILMVLLIMATRNIIVSNMEKMNLSKDIVILTV